MKDISYKYPLGIQFFADGEEPTVEEPTTDPAVKPYKSFASKEELTAYINKHIANVRKGTENKDKELEELKAKMWELENKDKFADFDPAVVEFLKTKLNDETPIEEQVKAMKKQYPQFLKETNALDTTKETKVDEEDKKKQKEEDLITIGDGFGFI